MQNVSASDEDPKKADQIAPKKEQPKPAQKAGAANTRLSDNEQADKAPSYYEEESEYESEYESEEAEEDEEAPILKQPPKQGGWTDASDE